MTNRKSQRRSVKKWRKKNPYFQLLANARNRARAKGLPFNLTKEDIVIPERCPVLDIPLKVNQTQSDTSPSIHRIDSTKGYTKDNIVIVSWRANNLIKNATLDELEKILCWYKKALVN